MSRFVKIIVIIIAVLIIIVIALPFVINVNNYRPQIESELTTALGRKVTVGNLSLSIFSGSVAADNIAIADDPAFGTAPFIQAKGLKVGVEVMPLISSKTLHITDLTLSQPQVALLRAASGRWNFSTLGGNTQKNTSSSDQSFEQNLSVAKLNIEGGQVSIADSSRAKPRIYQNVNVSVKNFSFSSQFPFTLDAELPGGGTLKLDGTAGPVNRSDAAVTPVQAKLAVKKLDLAASGFIDPESGIAGVADFDGTVNSDGKQAISNGTASIEKLKLSPKGSPAPRAVAVRYATTYELQKQTGQLTQGDVSVAKAVAKLGGTYDMHGESPVLNLKLNADNMPVDDLETLLPALGVTLPSGSSLEGGTLSSDLTISGPISKLVITGPVKVVNTKLKGFDMGSKLSAISALTGAKSGQDTSIQNFSSNVHVAPSGIQTENINLVVPAIGTLTGSGTISPQNALDYKMTASLSGGAVGGLSQMAGMGGKGATVPFFIQGTAS
ncbi:MAG TPA: AsmA family protein, partial [Terriglobales bacterium]